MQSPLLSAPLALCVGALLTSGLSAQAHGPQAHGPHAHEGCPHAGAAPAEAAFGALQERGKEAMGVDQYTSTHRFDKLADGGRIELQRDGADAAGVARIRAHLRDISAAFKAGDFRTPAFVHQTEVPGTRVMAEKRKAISYTFSELPRGGEVRIQTADPDALKAIHAFMDFQRQDHRAGGEDGHAGAHPAGHAHP